MSKCPVTASDLQHKTAYQIANKYCLPVIWADHQATRRQRLHGAVLPGDQQQYSSTHITEVLEHLHNLGYKQAIFLAETPTGHQVACWAEFCEIPDPEVKIE